MYFDAHSDIWCDVTTRRLNGETNVFDRCHLERMRKGGVEGMEKIKHSKAKLLYDVLDASRLFTCAAEKGSRSDMNVTFRSVSEELDAKFVKEATAAGFTNLKGHRSVGGMRASIYNAMPVEGVEKLADFIRAFDKNN